MLGKAVICQMTRGKDEGVLQEFIKEICWAVQRFKKDAEDTAASLWTYTMKYNTTHPFSNQYRLAPGFPIPARYIFPYLLMPGS